ncbi:UNVERIFIED_CONTAM: hypothetical protein K2H54_055231 [Gekko kuhli]
MKTYNQVKVDCVCLCVCEYLQQQQQQKLFVCIRNTFGMSWKLYVCVHSGNDMFEILLVCPGNDMLRVLKYFGPVGFPKSRTLQPFKNTNTSLGKHIKKPMFDFTQ